MLRVSNLKRGFGSGRRRLEVLKGVNLEVAPGELVSMMGPSGCGKSTLLNIIGGLLEADSGSISLGEFSYGTRAPSKVVDVRRRGVGWIFQDYHLLDRLSALDNVIFALELSGVPTAQAEEQAREALEKVGLADRMEFIPDQLSGGQRQRVAVARAIAGSRPLLLADEPTGNLDIKSGEEIIDLFHQLCDEEGMSVLMVTHDPSLASRADRMLLLKDGITADSDIRSAWGVDSQSAEQESGNVKER
jgi:putative ABC transport system ATP-binding protein|tara:strand:+ start:136 stop:873 length:738 start_codon:yes stop_codon:yes gene_type:complete